MKVFPLTRERWKDFEELFGERGACGGCWCMWWRLKRSEFEQKKGAENRRAMKRIVEAGEEPGLLAYVDGRAVGWCALARREAYPVLERSRNFKRVDEEPVWSITCFFIDRKFRRKGIATALLNSAVAYVKKKRGKIVEGYPVDPKKGSAPDVFMWTGVASAFRKVGFKEVARRSETRPIMRYSILTRF